MDPIQPKPQGHRIEHITIIVLVSFLLISMSAVLNTNVPTNQVGRVLIPSSLIFHNQPMHVLSAHTASTAAIRSK